MDIEYIFANYKYDPDTGNILARRNGEYSLCGWNHKGGGKYGKTYRRISVHKKQYAAHRVAWLLHFGEVPGGEIDHINGDSLDNRIVNLRVVDRYLQMRNLRMNKVAKSGRTGVHKVRNKWMANISIKGKMTYLGRFESFESACLARENAEVENGFHPQHGRLRQEASK
jgi:hypothetical protein